MGAKGRACVGLAWQRGRRVLLLSGSPQEAESSTPWAQLPHGVQQRLGQESLALLCQQLRAGQTVPTTVPRWSGGSAASGNVGVPLSGGGQLCARSSLPVPNAHKDLRLLPEKSWGAVGPGVLPALLSSAALAGARSPTAVPGQQQHSLCGNGLGRHHPSARCQQLPASHSSCQCNPGEPLSTTAAAGLIQLPWQLAHMHGTGQGCQCTGQGSLGADIPETLGMSQHPAVATQRPVAAWMCCCVTCSR